MQNENINQVARKFVKKLSDTSGGELMISRYLEFEGGCIFWYQSKEYVETKDCQYEIIGNTRFIVGYNSQIAYFDSGFNKSNQEYINDYLSKSGKV